MAWQQIDRLTSAALFAVLLSPASVNSCAKSGSCSVSGQSAALSVEGIVCAVLFQKSIVHLLGADKHVLQPVMHKQRSPWGGSAELQQLKAVLGWAALAVDIHRRPAPQSCTLGPTLHYVQVHAT